MRQRRHSRWVGRAVAGATVLGLALVGSLVPATPAMPTFTAGAAVRSPVPHIRRGVLTSALDQSTSPNWSGLVDVGTVFTSVSGNWTVPMLRPTSPENSAACTWVGIGGWNGPHRLIQAGTAEEMESGVEHYVAWFELLPADWTDIDEPVAPGDKMSASIEEMVPDSWLISVDDDTAGWSFVHVVDYDAAPAASAEWITERPQPEVGEPYEALANYGTTVFHGLQVSGKRLTHVRHTWVEMRAARHAPLLSFARAGAGSPAMLIDTYAAKRS